MVTGETNASGGGVARRTVLKRGAVAAGVASLGLTGVTGTAAAKKNDAVPIDGPTTITSSGYYVLTRDIVGEGGITVEPGVNDVTIDGQGYTLGGDGTVSTGIYVGDELSSQNENITIKNVHITDFASDGMDLQMVDGGVVRNVVFSGNASHGIRWAECSGVTVEDCTFSDNGMASFGYNCVGITFVRNYVSNGGGFTFGESFRITVSDNDFEYCNQCVWFDGSTDDVKVVDNRMYKSGVGVRLRVVFGGLVRGNQFVENDTAAIDIADVGDITIEKNNVFRNGEDGIRLEYPWTTNRIVKNNIFGNGEDGIHIVNGTSPTYIGKNRIFDNAGDGIELEYADNNVIRKNVIKRNGGVPVNVGSYSTGNVVEDNRT